MKSTRLLLIAVLVVLITVTATLLTKKTNPDVNDLKLAQTSTTMSHARKGASDAATQRRRSSRRESLSTAKGATIEEITHTSDTSSEEFWQESLTKIVNNDNLSDHELGKKLVTFASDPQAPEWARVEAMMDALAFTDDENYNQDIRPLAIRADLPESINDVILEDLLVRSPLSVLPAAREIASISGHPLADVSEEFVKSAEHQISSPD